MKLNRKWLSYYRVAWSPKVSLAVWHSRTAILFLWQLQLNLTNEITSASEIALSLRSLWNNSVLKNILWYEIIFSFHAVQFSSEYVFLFVLPTVCTAPSVCVASDILSSLGNVGSWLYVSASRQIPTHLFYVVKQIKSGNLEETKLCAIRVWCTFSYFHSTNDLYPVIKKKKQPIDCLHPPKYRNVGNSVLAYTRPYHFPCRKGF